MFGIGGFELFLILLFGFLLFGPDKLPAMAKTLGKAIGKFRNAQEEMNKVSKNEVYVPDSDEPFKNPLDVMEKAADAGKKAANGASKAVSSASKAVSQATHSAPSKAASQQPRTVAKQESVSERKARYDRERAAKLAADAEKAEAAKQAALAAADAKSTEAATPAAAAPASAPPAATQSASTEAKGE